MVSLLLAVVGLAIVAVAPGQSRAANLTTLVSFCALANCADGTRPRGGLIADAAGNLFGTTADGGANGGGTVFKIAKTADGYASTPTTLVSFCALANCADGSGPFAGLIADASGNLFGTTQGGGAHGGGTAFEIARTIGGYASAPTVLVSFCALANCADGAVPNGPLVADASGNLFGTTFVGGANNLGTVFEIVKTPDGYDSTPITLVSFCASANCAGGAHPAAGLIVDAEGNLFGATQGGPRGGGSRTVFEIVKTDSGYDITPIILASVGQAAAGPIADAKGNLFGTTVAGGANDGGTVFEVAKTPDGYASTPTILVSFCAPLGNCVDGAVPQAGLIADPRANLFGTTAGGGVHNGGTAFEITDSGFVIFAGTPGKPNCFGQSVFGAGPAIPRA
jgi:uncharacterized repeat protein (TIGR03803 family)